MSDVQGTTAGWLSAAKAGSPEALGQALQACHGYLLLVAKGELDPALQAKGGASDLVQETFLKAHRAFAQFKGDSEQTLLAWLRELLLNSLTDFERRYQQTGKRQVRRERTLGDRAAWAAPGIPRGAANLTPSGQVMRQEEVDLALSALARLPDEYRLVITMRYQENRSFDEIGILLGRTANAARKLLLRALERVQHDLKIP